MDQIAEPLPLRRALVSPFAILSLGAAAIHFGVIGAHFAEWWAFGLAMAAIAWFQALWALAYLLRPAVRLAFLGAVANLGIAGLWAWSRVFGLPFGPGASSPQPLGVPDVIATGLELVLVVALIVSAAGPIRRGTEARRVARPTLAAWSAVIAVVVGLATSAAIAHGMGPL